MRVEERAIVRPSIGPVGSPESQGRGAASPLGGAGMPTAVVTVAGPPRV